MEKINKVYAVILDRSESGYGSGGNCKVVGLIYDSEIITNTDEIAKYIKSNNTIYSGILFEVFKEGKVNDLIEINVEEITPNNAPGKNFYVKHSEVKKIGTPVIDIPNHYLKKDFIDLDSISKYLSEEKLYPSNQNQIYICDEKSIFGPFKIDKSKISPIIGKHTFSFEYDINEMIEDEALKYLYLINKPKVQIKSIDCSTPAQLMDFLKERIKVERPELNLLTRIGKEINQLNENMSELDVVRLKRSSNYIDQISLSLNELHDILNNKDAWNKEIGNVVNKYRDEFKNNALSDINYDIQSKENELVKKQKEIELTDKEIADKKTVIEQLSNELEKIKKNKDEIILNIKLLAEIQSEKSVNNITNKNQNFVTVNIENKPQYNNIDDFCDELEEKHNIKLNKITEYEDGILLLKENKFFIAKSTEYVLNLISILGKSEIVIQNAEVDWLKFNYWRENGLEEIVNKALQIENYSFIYILQDFNIASFECYGKPILDISNKIRKSLFNNKHFFPSNLKIILIKADEEIEDFVFELNKSTFKNWKFLPDITNENIIDIPQCNGIDLENFQVNRNTKNYSESYF